MSTIPQHSDTYDDVPLPDGAITDPDGWDGWSNKFRVVRTPERTVDGQRCTVYGSALQLPDGRIDDGTTDKADPPGVFLEFGGEVTLTTNQARQLAAFILTTADQIDGWTSGPSTTR